MGHSTNIYGIISTPVGSNIDLVWSSNMKIIDSLPTEDNDFPFISNRMFSKDFQPGWEERIIHFAANYKNIEFGQLQEWINKFETIISEMMWLHVKTHIETDISGSYEVNWNIDNNLLLDWQNHNWLPTSKWTSEGLQKK